MQTRGPSPKEGKVMTERTRNTDFSLQQEMSQTGRGHNYFKMRGRGARTYTTHHQPFVTYKYNNASSTKTDKKAEGSNTEPAPIVAPRMVAPPEKKEAEPGPSSPRDDWSNTGRGHQFSVRNGVIHQSFPRNTTLSSAILTSEKFRLTVPKAKIPEDAFGTWKTFLTTKLTRDEMEMLMHKDMRLFTTQYATSVTSLVPHCVMTEPDIGESGYASMFYVATIDLRIQIVDYVERGCAAPCSTWWDVKTIRPSLRTSLTTVMPAPKR